jgi:hypothetical protein
VWAGLVAGGIHAMYQHETASGARLEAPAQWPAATSLVRGTPRFSIIMFVHPECPCTRASLIELEALTTRAHDYAITIVFSAPDGEMWSRASRIAGAKLVADADGREARRFGAATSGHVVVYERDVLRFAGGITGSRGHAGFNGGRRAVEQILAGDAGETTRPVFGCAFTEAVR